MLSLFFLRNISSYFCNLLLLNHVILVSRVDLLTVPSVKAAVQDFTAQNLVSLQSLDPVSQVQNNVI